MLKLKERKLKKALEKLSLERLIFDAPMAEYTSFKCGGRAYCLAEPSDEADIKALIDIAKSFGKEYLILGNGSNMLFSDRGYDGIVIRISKAFSDVNVDGNTLTAGAGALISSVSKAAAANKLSGLEFACGIPGSVGGAVFMNAGAYDHDMSECIKSVKSADAEGNVKVRSASELELAYRHSIFEDNKEIILEASFELKPEDASEIEARMADYTARRTSKQPLSYPSAGSFFKRPLGNFAGALIEKSGLKGLQIGGAQVSELHAGFIINTGNATAQNVIDLMNVVRETVFNDSGVELEPEVRIID